MFISYEPPCTPWGRTDGHRCSLMTEKKLLVIDRNGRQHSVIIETCPCEDLLVTLLKHELWAASPQNPTLAIHLDLMEWARVLQLEGFVSVLKFVDALAAKMQSVLCHNENKRTSTSIYRTVIQDCIDEYRYFIYKLQASAGLPMTLDDGTNCPACNGNPDDKKLFSIDGNFGLVRKKSSGVSALGPKHSRYFVDQTQVDSFLQDNSTKEGSANQIRECSDFQAGSAVRSKGKSANLDEKGVLGSACRHEIPLLFCSLKHGERFLYPVYLLKELMKVPQLKVSMNITVVYDVACQLEGHLQTHHPDLPLDRFQFAIPVFHAYGHKLLCQLTQSLRSVPGVGLVDGETMERLWSYLRSFGPMTKEMRPSKRVDLLTDALIHCATKHRRKIGQALCQRSLRATKAKMEAEHEVTTLLGGLDVVTEETIQKWSDEDIKYLRSASSRPRMSAAEDYVIKLSVLYSTGREEAESAVRQLEDKHGFNRPEWSLGSPQYIEKLHIAVEKRRQMLLHKLRQEAFDRKFLINSLRRYGIGQAISGRLSIQIKKSSKRLSADVHLYNALSHCATSGPMPATLTFEEASDPEKVLKFSCATPTTTNDIPTTVRRQIVAAYNKKKRCQEENELVASDIASSLRYFAQQHDIVLAAIKTMLQEDLELEDNINFQTAADMTMSPGLLSFLFTKLLTLERETESLCSATNYPMPNCFATPALDFLRSLQSAACAEPENVVVDCEDNDQKLSCFLEELDDCENKDIVAVLEALAAEHDGPEEDE